MASGRVGGTKSRISGQIGSEVYQVRRNPDGSYSQIVMAKGTQTANYTTPKLQAQRMMTAMVESLMKQLQPIATISMQSAANKSKSLNAFSSFNLSLVAKDCAANWYGNQVFVYPRQIASKNYVIDLGGLYMISSGTLQYNCFDVLNNGMMFGNEWYNSPLGFGLWFGLQFYCSIGTQTVGDFLRAHRMTRIDSVVFVGFRTFMRYNPVTGEEDENLHHEYIIAYINPTIPDTAILTIELLQNLFILESSYQPYVIVHKSNSFFAIAFVLDSDGVTEDIYYYAGFSISYLDGRKKISFSSYESTRSSGQPWLSLAAPANVFGSWMGEPWIDPYPSPY